MVENAIFEENDQAYGVGHAVFAKSPNGKQHWLIYQAKESAEGGREALSIRMQGYGWHADQRLDYPNFNKPVRSSYEHTCP
jgi:GH43 family beta-xylosidase